MMNEFKGTPGPWQVVRCNPSPTSGEVMIRGSKPGYLAEVRDCGSGDVDANARLIAAAPELLEALQKMVKIASTGLVDFNPHDELVMSSARAAIAKATAG